MPHVDYRSTLRCTLETALIQNHLFYLGSSFYGKVTNYLTLSFTKGLDVFDQSVVMISPLILKTQCSAECQLLIVP